MKIKAKTVKANSIKINDKFNKLTVIGIIYYKKGNAWVQCKCDCGTQKDIRLSKLVHGTTRSCGCEQRKTGKYNNNWTGFEEISGKFLKAIRAGANSRHLEYSITNEYIWELFLKQERKCALSGQLLFFASKHKTETTGIKETASLDRIDSSKGYIEGNVQWVHKRINMMKQALTDEAFIKNCILVADYQRELKNKK